MRAIKQSLIAGFALLLIAILTVPRTSVGQERGGEAAAARTAARNEDHQNMMAQLGIHKLRPGPSGTETDPNHANYDEATANPYPDLPEVLTLKNGKKVTSAKMW